MEVVSTDRADFWRGVKDCIPTWIGYIGVGLAVGVVSVASGLAIWQVLLFSVVVYAGSAQLIIAALLVAGSPVLAIIFTTFIVNLRNLLLGMTIAPHFASSGRWSRVGLGTLLTDESFGVAAQAIAEGKRVNAAWMHGLNVSACFIWLVSTTLGAVIGEWVPDPTVYGLDFALPALFTGLLVFQLAQEAPARRKLSFELIVTVIVTMALTSLVFPTYVAILAGTLVGATVGTVRSR